MRRSFIVFLILALAGSFLLVSGDGFMHGASAQKVVKDESLRRGEIRPTLDPGMFENQKVRKAYQIAWDIPWVLDSIYCFCYCSESFKHKSLLSCYVDNHASV
jgi:hypothetical protein